MMRLSIKNKKLIISVLISVALMLAAILCGVVSNTAQNPFVVELAMFTRFFLYFSLFSLWCVSVHRRIIQLQARLHFVVVAVLMVIWLTMKEFRCHLVYNENLSRILWYSYYIPILLILLLGFFISLSLGKSEKYQLSKWTGLMFFPTLLFIVLVLTNDLHQWIFIFPDGDLIHMKLDYRYGFLFYILAAWCGICILATIFTLFIKSRILQTGRFLWLPLVPLFSAVLYAIVYVTRFPILGRTPEDVTILNCLLFIAFFETCIQCGLIQSNTCYFDIFRASVDLSAQITDYDYNVCYAAGDAGVILPEDMRRAESGVVILADGRRLHNIEIYGGHAVWTEDISELLELRETLAETREDLKERNEFLSTMYKQEKEYLGVMEKNRLYDLLQRQTQSQLDRVRQFADEYEKVESQAKKRHILSKIVILGSYIKRRKDFVLMMEGSSLVSENSLKSALEESFRSLRLGRVRGGYIVETGLETMDGDTVLLAYDFFESVLESVLDSIRYIAVRVVRIGGELRCAVAVDFKMEAGELLQRYPRMQTVCDEDGGTEFILPLTGGEDL